MDIDLQLKHRHRHAVAHDPDAVTDPGAYRAQPESAVVYTGC